MQLCFPMPSEALDGRTNPRSNALEEARQVPWKALLTLWFKADPALPEKDIVGAWLDAKMPREELK